MPRQFRCSLLLLVTLFLAGQRVAAQSRIHFGPMAGVSVANWHGDDAQEVGSIVRFAGGGFVRVPLSEVFTFEPQLLFVQKGSKLGVGTDGPTTVKLNYIELPLLIKARIPSQTSAFRASFFAGPAIGSRRGCRVTGEGTSAGLNESCADTGIRIRSTDFSLIFGLEFEVKQIVVQWRYDLGWNKIDDASPPADVTNRAFLITLGYSL